MLGGFFGKFGELLNKLLGKKPVSILSDSELASSFDENDSELRSSLRDELNTYYQTEKLIRDYENVRLQRERIYTDPSFVTLNNNQQLAARVILVGIDGRKIELDIYFKTGEKFSQEGFYKKIAGELPNIPLNNLTRSEYVRLATIESNFYVQSWVKK